MKKIIFLATTLLLVLAQVPSSHAAEKVSCTMEYNPVCGQPAMPKCPDGMSCAQVMPQPKTYSNSCAMAVDNATLKYAGECHEENPYTEDSHGCSTEQGFVWDASANKCVQKNKTQEVVTWAFQKKLTKFGNLLDFGFNSPLSRQEAAAFATRIVTNLQNKDLGMIAVKMQAYDDQNDIDTTLQNDVMKARFAGIMNGNNNIFSPRNSLSWAEAAAMLVRLVDGKNNSENAEKWYEADVKRLSLFGIDWEKRNIAYSAAIPRGEFITAVAMIFKDSSENITKNDTKILGDWNLETWNGKKLSEYSISKIPTLQFEPNDVKIKICNSIFGQYKTESGAINAPHLASTLVGCQGEISKLEAAFSLHQASYSVTSLDGKNILTLTTKKGNIFTLSQKNTAVTELIPGLNGKWSFVSYTHNNTLQVSDDKYKNIILEMNGNKLSTKFCNHMNSELTFTAPMSINGNVMSTRMSCDNETLMKLERNFNLTNAKIQIINTANTPHINITTATGDVYSFKKM